jgi:hypothetical protein
MKKIILAAIISSCSSLFASTIQHTGLDSARSMTIEIRADGSVRNVKAGIGQLLVDGSELIDVLCVNLFQGITVNQTYAAVSIDAEDYDFDGSAAAWLMETFLPVVNASTGLLQKIQGAALQLAVWDTIHDGGNGFSDGRIRATSGTNSQVLALANQWRLEALDENGSASVYKAAPGSRAFQQQMYLSVDYDAEVPEPGTLVMLAIGSLAVLFGSWRRRRQGNL